MHRLPIEIFKEKSRTGTLDGLEVSSPELLRAAPARLLLRRFGKIFESSEGEAKTFEMSRTVTNIDAFLSHSWRTQGWLKAIALMYWLNRFRAFWAGLVVHALVHGLDHAGFTFPIPPSASGCMFDGDKMLPFRWQMHYVPACLAFLFVMVYGQEIPCVRQTMCFLDKCCIHQTDQEKKMAGIRQLGGFLQRSQTMVIFWQPEYLTRLWCVYEVAAFHFLNPNRQDALHLVPLKLPLFTLGIFFFHFAASISLTILSPLLLFSDWHVAWVMETIPGWGQYLYLVVNLMCIMFFGLYLIPSFFFWKFCRWHMKDRRRLLLQLRNFSMDQTECQVPEDRELVVHKIERWFGSTADFENYVREDLYSLVYFQLEQTGPIRYRMACIGSLPHLFICLTMAIHAAEDGQWDIFWRLILSTPLVCLCTDAIALNLSLHLADRTLSADGGSHKIFGPVMMALCFAIVNAVSVAVWTPAIPLSFAGGIAAFLCIVTFLLYGGRARAKYVRHSISRRLSSRLSSRISGVTEASPASRGPTESHASDDTPRLSSRVSGVTEASPASRGPTESHSSGDTPNELAEDSSECN